jgi:hypothetical protein
VAENCVSLGQGFYHSRKVFDTVGENVAAALEEYLALVKDYPPKQKMNKKEKAAFKEAAKVYYTKCSAAALTLMKMVFPGKTAEYGIYPEDKSGPRFHGVRYDVMKGKCLCVVHYAKNRFSPNNFSQKRHESCWPKLYQTICQTERRKKTSRRQCAWTSPKSLGVNAAP